MKQRLVIFELAHNLHVDLHVDPGEISGQQFDSLGGIPPLNGVSGRPQLALT